MRSTLFRSVGILMLAAPFVLLGSRYTELPESIPLLRSWSFRTLLWSDRSLISVFRVPTIGVLTAASIELMRQHSRNQEGHELQSPLQKIWDILFFTVCAKTLFEGLELASLATSRPEAPSLYSGLTIATVIVGLGLVAYELPRTWPLLKQSETWRLTGAERWILGALGLGYLTVAIVPLILAKGQR